MDNNKKPSEPSEAERWALKNVPTAQLVAELSNREGVEATIAEPYQDAEVKVNGPAIVLVVIRLKPLEMPANGSMKETLKNPQANSILR